MNGVVLVAEADGRVGMGHLAEVSAVARALKERGVAARLIAIGDSKNSEVESVSDYTALAAKLDANERVILWSVRTDRWRRAWNHFASARNAWVADVADDYPAVDVLIVPTLQPRWRAAQASTRVLAGPQYFPLDVRGRRDVPNPSARQRDVLLSLGGADRTEASLRIIPALGGTKSTVVIGPAFRHRDGVERAAKKAGIDRVNAPDGLRDLLLQHRLVISAGGNTLFEAAAAGTPALVAWEDPHEETQGNAFAAAGAACVIGRGADLDPRKLQRTVSDLLQSSDLDAMSAAGRQLVDGRGADRIADLLIDLARGVAA